MRFQTVLNNTCEAVAMTLIGTLQEACLFRRMRLDPRAGWLLHTFIAPRNSECVGAAYTADSGHMYTRTGEQTVCAGEHVLRVGRMCSECSKSDGVGLAISVEAPGVDL